MEMIMEKPVVLITGGLTGIGRAAAVAFARKGAKVVVAGRRDEAGKALVKELRSLGSEAEFINADIRKEDDVRAMVDKAVARFGRLDVAVNNAATEGQVGPITDQTAESFAATFETNVLGVVLSMKHEVRAMQAQGSGSIINISSTYGHKGAAFASIYVGAKHAGSARSRQIRNSCQRRWTRPHGHRDADPLHRHRREQGGFGDTGSVGPAWTLRGGRRRYRLPGIGRSQIHDGSRPQR
jgi:NAD(P)-dependent dehydrogenase (short-subunit alcohol dehydrogenase family)